MCDKGEFIIAITLRGKVNGGKNGRLEARVLMRSWHMWVTQRAY